jgi:hypothetical protein
MFLAISAIFSSNVFADEGDILFKIQDVKVEDHDKSFKRWMKKPFHKSAKIMNYSICENGSLITQEGEYLLIYNLNDMGRSVTKIHLGKGSVGNCLYSDEDGEVVAVFSNGTVFIYEIKKKVEKKIIILGIEYSYYEGSFQIACGDRQCINAIQSLKKNALSAFLVNRNHHSEIENIYSLRFYGIFNTIMYGWRDWSLEHRKTLYCAPYDRRFILTISDIQPCPENFKKYLNASAVMSSGDKIIFQHEQGIEDEICDIRMGSCVKWIGNGISAYSNYRVLGRDYYMFLDLRAKNEADSIRQSFFCDTFDGRGCLQFESKEIIQDYFVVGKRRYTLSSRPSDDENEETTQYNNFYLNYSDIN